VIRKSKILPCVPNYLTLKSGFPNRIFVEKLITFFIHRQAHICEIFKDQKNLTAESANQLLLNYCQGVKSCQENLIERAVICLPIL